MHLKQTLLFPDPRPLVERLGVGFFREAPEGPGVYLMRDAGGSVLYVGKAKNLRRRLASYRVANPDRLRRRHLRLLRAVAGIELEVCADESAALGRESELLQSLRPRFNRAGTWPAPARYLGWRVRQETLQLAIASAAEPDWAWHGPLGGSAQALRATLLRLLWCALHPERGLTGMPQGWFSGGPEEIASIPGLEAGPRVLEEAAAQVSAFFAGESEAFATWVRERTVRQDHRFEAAAREADLESMSEFARRRFADGQARSDPAAARRALFRTV